MAAFALIHGAWHDETCWGPLAEQLTTLGHTVVAPRLPCDDPAAGIEEYVAETLALIGPLEAAPIVVGHSLGSDTAMVVAARHPVARLIHLCPRLGGIPRPDDAPRQFQPTIKGWTTDEQGRDVWAPGAAIANMYPRLDPALARELVTRLRPQADLRGRPFPIAAHPEVATTLLYTAQDEFFRPEWERWAADTWLGVERHELGGGHFPMLERPAELAALLDAL